MGSTSYLSSSNETGAPRRRRVMSFVLAIIAHLLIAWLLLTLAPSPFHRPAAEKRTVTFDVLPEATADTPRPKGTKSATAKEARQSGGRKAQPDVQPQTAPSEVAPPPVPAPNPQLALLGGMDLFHAADISKMRGRASDGDGQGDGSGSGKDSTSAYGPGDGPGGQRLYNAEWYREPSRAELAGYMPASANQTGWGMIACQTIPNYRVENCRELGESPMGSGLSRALRQAAWQFRVLPPRVGGKQMIGAWVRIRFDFTVTPAK